MSRERLPWLTALNVLSSFSVVMLHNNIFWEHPRGALWFDAVLIECLFYFAVPVFFMISGATLLDYRQRYSTTVFFRGRAKKALLPFLFWSLFAAAWDSVKLVAAGQTPDLHPLRLLVSILNARYLSIYWFFIPLFAIYLSFPVLSQIEDKLSACGYITFVGVIFISFLPLLFSLFHLPWNGNLTPPIAGGYLLLPVMGYYLSRKELTLWQRRAVYLLGLAGLLMHFLGTYLLSGEEIDQTFKGYTNLPGVLYSAAVFLFVRQLTIPAKFLAVLEWFAKRTFGIYLLHHYVTGVVILLIGPWRTHPLWLLFGPVVIFLLSAGLVYLLQKIPLVRRFVP